MPTIDVNISGDSLCEGSMDALTLFSRIMTGISECAGVLSRMRLSFMAGDSDNAGVLGMIVGKRVLGSSVSVGVFNKNISKIFGGLSQATGRLFAAAANFVHMEGASFSTGGFYTFIKRIKFVFIPVRILQVIRMLLKKYGWHNE